MEANTEVMIAFGLFVASELIGMSKYRSNSLLQLLLGAAVRAYPYERKAKAPNPLDSLLGRKDRR
jgi:hypothetical protein